MRRRTFLTLSTAAAAATTLNLPTASAAAPTDFAALRAKWAADVTGREVIDPADGDPATQLVGEMTRLLPARDRLSAHETEPSGGDTAKSLE